MPTDAVRITPSDLAELRRGAAPHALLDLRERGAAEQGHIYRATPLARRLLEFRLPTLVTARGTPVVLCDADGRLAELAAPTLAAMGYRDVRLLDGGVGTWRAEGRPLVQGANVPSKVFGEQVLHERGTPQIPPAELRAWMDAGTDMVIVDTRTPEEYQRGCIPGAWSVPGGELVLRIADLVRKPDTTIVVHCGGRTRSYLGTESLRRMNLPNRLVALENGTMGWTLARLDLERGASRWAPEPSARSRALASTVAKRVAAEDGVRLVSPEDLMAFWARRHERNLTVLDVRTSPEYAAGHVAGAAWAPGSQVIQATDEYIGVRAATVVLVCDGFVRATMTASWLQRMGFADVAVLAGGLPAWERAGGPVETGHPSPPPAGHEAARARVALIPPGHLGDATVLSVDTSDVYTAGHVPGAAWVCRSRLEWRVADVAPDRTRPVVVTCGDGRHSLLAGATLSGLGYTTVRVLDGGTRAWQAAGLPIERGATRLRDEADDVLLKPYDRGRQAMEAYLRWEEELDDEGRSPVGLLPGSSPTRGR